LSEEELLLLDDLVEAGASASGFPNDLWDTRRVASLIRWKVLREQYIHNRSFTSANETLIAARSGLRALQHSSELQGVYLECQRYFG
jgi:hypothetical protein